MIATMELGRLLIVDDESELLQILCERLQLQGYQAVGCSSGQEALAILQERSFDLLLTDLLMPGLDGLTLLAEVQKADPHMAIVLMTGQATIQTAVDALKSGALDYVMKPFKTNTILPVVNRALELRRLRLANVALQETMALQELCQAIASTLDWPTLLDRIVDAAMQQVRADEVSLMLPSADGQELCVSVVRGGNREGLLGQKVPMATGVAGWVARHQEPITLDGTVQDPRFVPVKPRADIRHAVSLPLLAGGRLVGVLNVNVTRKRQPITPGQVKALCLLANAGAAALENTTQLSRTRAAEERYRSVFDNAREGICQIAPDGRFLTANPTLARILGYASPQELMTRGSCDQLFGVKCQCFQEVAAHPGWWHCECPANRQDGSTVWLAIAARAARDAQGTILYYEWCVEDVSQRRQVEDRFAKVFRNNPLPIAITAVADGRFIDLNDSALNLLGYKREEVIGRPSSELGFWSCSQERQAFLDALQAGGQIHNFETTIVTRDGLEHSLLYAAELIQFGDEPCILAIWTDVTERNRNLETVRRLARIVESSDDAIYSVTPEGVVTSWNRGAEALFGYRAAEIVGQSVKCLVPADRAQEPAVFLEQIQRGESLKNRETARLSRDGRAIQVSLTAYPIRDQDGRLLEIAGIFRDITEQKRLEEQFRQSQKMEAFGKLAGGVAHDFNNILTAINGFGQLLVEELTPDTNAHTFARQIMTAGERAAGLTRQLLAFSRKQVLAPEVIDINDVVRENEKMLRRLIGEDIALRVALEPNLYCVKVDPGQLGQVILNLAVNARDAMPRGGTLRLETTNVHVTDKHVQDRPDLQPGTFVRLTVADTGSGIAPAIINRIFEPYFTTKDPGKGTGLGLAMVAGIVQQSGGFITVDSVAGFGTTFHVHLPPASPQQPPVKARRSSAGFAGNIRGSETILIVEDDPSVRGLASTILKDHGYQVLDAANAQEAWPICQSHPGTIHLLLTDVVLPDISGKDLGGCLAELLPNLKVLYMSGYMDDALQRHGLEQEGLFFLRKPFTVQTLCGTVREVLDAPDFLASDGQARVNENYLFPLDRISP